MRGSGGLATGRTVGNITCDGRRLLRGVHTHLKLSIVEGGKNLGTSCFCDARHVALHDLAMFLLAFHCDDVVYAVATTVATQLPRLCFMQSPLSRHSVATQSPLQSPLEKTVVATNFLIRSSRL